MAEPEFHVTTDECDVRPDCGLVGYHIHLGDQLFYSVDELPPEEEKTNLDRVRDWINTAMTRTVSLPVAGPRRSDHSSGRAFDFNGRADHRNHVHVSIGESIPRMDGDDIELEEPLTLAEPDEGNLCLDVGTMSEPGKVMIQVKGEWQTIGTLAEPLELFPKADGPITLGDLSIRMSDRSGTVNFIQAERLGLGVNPPSPRFGPII
jgi:hypothetical protein